MSDAEKLMISNGLHWHVAPDYGELDGNVVGREHDIANGYKYSGWSNPLAKSDDGNDDDRVLVQTKYD